MGVETATTLRQLVAIKKKLQLIPLRKKVVLTGLTSYSTNIVYKWSIGLEIAAIFQKVAANFGSYILPEKSG